MSDITSKKKIAEMTIEEQIAHKKAVRKAWTDKNTERLKLYRANYYQKRKKAEIGEQSELPADIRESKVITCEVKQDTKILEKVMEAIQPKLEESKDPIEDLGEKKMNIVKFSKFISGKKRKISDLKSSVMVNKDSYFD